MIARMKIILKLTVEVKEIEEHISYERKRQKIAGREKRMKKRKDDTSTIRECLLFKVRRKKMIKPNLKIG